MSSITFHRITPEDKDLIEQVAAWYFKEWNIALASTTQRLSELSPTGIPFHVMMKVDDLPVATGGIAHHVSLLSEEPRLKIYQPWLALVYTTTENQNKGYGTLLCYEIERILKELGVKEYYLFTYTAEKLYLKLGWEIMERLAVRDKDIVVMKKKLEGHTDN